MHFDRTWTTTNTKHSRRWKTGNIRCSWRLTTKRGHSALTGSQWTTIAYWQFAYKAQIGNLHIHCQVPTNLNPQVSIPNNLWSGFGSERKLANQRHLRSSQWGFLGRKTHIQVNIIVVPGLYPVITSLQDQVVWPCWSLDLNDQLKQVLTRFDSLTVSRFDRLLSPGAISNGRVVFFSWVRGTRCFLCLKHFKSWSKTVVMMIVKY